MHARRQRRKTRCRLLYTDKDDNRVFI